MKVSDRVAMVGRARRVREGPRMVRVQVLSDFASFLSCFLGVLWKLGGSSPLSHNSLQRMEFLREMRQEDGHGFPGLLCPDYVFTLRRHYLLQIHI